MQRTLIWDLPTRLFHWCMVLSFAGAWLTTESDRWLSIHVFLGYLMLALVGFRVIWGLVGTYYARFSSFWYGPRSALAYLRQVLSRSAERHVGHNPAGSLAIYALLLLTVVVGISGVMTIGAEEQQGLLSGWRGIGDGHFFKNLHELAATLMLLLVTGHIAGVIVESWLHQENLAHSMVNGIKLARPDVPAAQPRTVVAALMALATLGFGLWWFFYALHDPLEAKLGRSEVVQDKPHVAFTGPKLADDAQWRDECSSCHIAYHPSLLPARSWKRLMADQNRHFGAELGLDAPTSAAVLAFLEANSAEQHATEAAFKIEQSIAPTEAPTRISQTPYWLKKHSEIDQAVWLSTEVSSRGNCQACHQDAQAGTFEDGVMHLPATITPPKKTG